MTSKLKDHVGTAAMALFGVGTLYVAMRGREFGVSGWLAAVLGLTVFVCVVLLFTFRSLDPLRKRGSLLMAGGLVCLSIAGLVNEYLVAFFTPSMFHLPVAILPAIAFVAYRGYKDSAKSESR